MADIEKILEKAKEVDVIGERDGRKIVSIEDQMALATKENMEAATNQVLGKESGDIGGIKWNPDGTLARTKGNTAAVNLDNFYANRYRKIKNKYYVVTDFLAIRGIAENKIPYPQIEAYIISNQEGEIVCEKKVVISDKEFLADYTHKLDHASMKQVLDAISKLGVESEADSLEF